MERRILKGREERRGEGLGEGFRGQVRSGKCKVQSAKYEVGRERGREGWDGIVEWERRKNDLDLVQNHT